MFLNLVWLSFYQASHVCLEKKNNIKQTKLALEL